MPKLPADLPENWTQGQTISPNGTEVGMTEQYGYNYLMKQVNTTQTEVNNINDALPDVAQQTTVNEIKNKIGTESDADTQPTLFGRLAQLKNVMVEKLTELLTKVTGIEGKIGTSGDTAGTATLFGQVKDISKKMPTGAVKSIQRGYYTSQDPSIIYTATYSEINPEKTFVILDVIGFGMSGSVGFNIGVKEIGKTSMVIEGKLGGNNYTVVWQLVEMQ